jgi:integrase
LRNLRIFSLFPVGTQGFLAVPFQGWSVEIHPVRSTVHLKLAVFEHQCLPCTRDFGRLPRTLKQPLNRLPVLDWKTEANSGFPRAERDAAYSVFHDSGVCHVVVADSLFRDYRINGRKTLDDVQTRWRLHLEPFFGSRRVLEVTSDLIARYVDQRQVENAQNATINREMAALKRMFRIAMYSTPPKVLRLPKFPKLTENNIRKGFLEDAQYEKLIGYFPDVWFRTLVEMGRTYGWRISELINLRVRQVDIGARIIRLEPGTTKNKDGREVTMTRAVHALLAQCVEGKAAGDAVFTRSDGKAVRDFRDAWAKATEFAGVPGLLFHDLRRTAGRNLRRAGIAEGVIMKIGGWRTRSVFERYAIVSQTDIADALKKLEAI